MPAQSKKPKGDSVEVSVRGANHEELRSRALDIAAAYFGLEHERDRLTLEHFHAEPHQRDLNNTVLEYKAEFKCYLKPLPGTEDEDDDPRPRIFGLASRPRPRGPLNDDDDPEGGWDEDENESQLDGDEE